MGLTSQCVISGISYFQVLIAVCRLIMIDSACPNPWMCAGWLRIYECFAATYWSSHRIEASLASRFPMKQIATVSVPLRYATSSQNPRSDEVSFPWCAAAYNADNTTTAGSFWLFLRQSRGRGGAPCCWCFMWKGKVFHVEQFRGESSSIF